VETLTSAIQKHVATVSISPSTVRGQGAPGVVAVVRDHLASLRLSRFRVSDRGAFRRSLEGATQDLVSALPAAARSWGLARKCLNVFLRDSFYNARLVSEFGLGVAEPFFEVPLDRIVAKELRRHAGRGLLPIWPGVRHLTADMSEVYQAFALELSASWGIARVYLDTYLWVEGRERPGA